MRLDKQQTTNACWMRRSTVTDDDDDDDSHRSSSTSPATGLNEKSGHGKRSLEDYGFLSSSSSQVKRRRHLSPQNSNIESTPTMLKKKSQTKKKSNSSMEENGRTKSKCSSRQSNGGASDQMNELTLPNWERICPHLDQILSNKHCQSGVYAHEVQLVQQELEALLSMSIVRENILKDFQHSSTSNAEDVRSKILKHQEAERFYSSKKLSKKPTTGTPVNSTPFLDRQVAVAPQQGARIDRIWSDVDHYLSRISSSDLRDLENLVEFHENLHEILSSSSLNDPSELSEALRPFNCPTVEHFLQAPTVLSHYLDRTTLGSFQKKLYEQIGQTSPVYRTPISSPMHHSRTMDSSLRISPRLHPQEFHPDESSKLKRKGKSVLLSPSSTMKFHERFQLVQHYLTDEHLQPSTVKRQLFPSSTKKRQHSPSESSSISENFQRKLSTLIGLVKECQSISSNALARARRQRDYEQIREKCRTIESDLQSYVEKFDLPTTHSNNEKSLQTLRQTLIEWEKLEDQLRQVLQPI